MLRLWGGRAAIAALVLQLAISAGHMHPEDLFGPAGHLTGPGDASLQAAGRDRQVQAPADQQSSSGVDGCAICETMQLVATAVPVLPFQLRAPQVPIGGLTPLIAAALPGAAPFRLFQSRAPPLV